MNGERGLVRAWQQGLAGPLRTVDGHLLAVVYRGRCLGGAGPDVRGALLAFDGGTLREGDVEFHLRSGDWRAHGHHRDAHYRGVILHVVATVDGPGPTDLDGQPIPTLVIPPEQVPATADGFGPDADTCHRQARERPAEILAALDALGDRRLTQRAARFEADLTRLTPEQLAYEAVFDALGFSRNRDAFVRLAQRVPYTALVALLGRRPDGDATLVAEAVLFGVAGLLPSQRSALAVDWEGDALVDELEGIWALYRSDWEGFGLDAADWLFGGIRPANYPTRRIATAARLVARHRQVGLDAVLLDPLRTVADSRTLEDVFRVEEPESYWATHCDFGRALPGHPAALLGRDRASEAVVNVLLPFALACAAQRDNPNLANLAWTTYRALPRHSAYEVTRKLADDLGLATRQFASARRQQGLLHLVRNHCEHTGCRDCPLTTP